MHPLRWLPLSAVAALVALPGPAAATLIRNGSFEVARAGPGPWELVTPDDTNASGLAAAEDWTLFNNNAGTTTSELLPTTLPEPGAGSLMMHVTTNNSANGLVNVFLPLNTGPARALASAWVYVNSGQVGMGSGNGGGTGLDAFSTTIGQWERLEALNGNSPANELIIYASVGTGADFFVDLVSVQAVSEPSSLTLFSLSLLALLGRKRKRSATGL